MSLNVSNNVYCAPLRGSVAFNKASVARNSVARESCAMDSVAMDSVAFDDNAKNKHSWIA